MDDRLISSIMTNEDLVEVSLRPKMLSEYVGQEQIKSNLNVYISAALKRGEPLDHCLLSGPPGLGKTTLAHIIATEMKSQIKVTSGPAIERAADLAAILTNLSEGDVLFIDEIHRLNKNIEEVLYPAMEDFSLDFVIGKGPSAKSVRLSIPKFTLIGATTRSGMLSAPLRDRFGVLFKLEMYSAEELKLIVIRSAKLLKLEINEDAAMEIASRSRGTPRVANRILRRVRDFADFDGKAIIDIDIAKTALQKLDIDNLGLDRLDRDFILSIIDKFSGGPVGLDTIAATVGEDSITLEDVVEPYLLKLGFIQRTPRGRIACDKAYEHFNIAKK